MKLYFATDLHYNGVSPASRIDDFPVAILSKLSYLLAVMESSDLLVLGGDVFSKPVVSEKALIDLVEVLRKREGQILTIFGNHDFSLSSVWGKRGSALQLLVAAGVVEALDERTWGRWNLRGFDFDEPFVESPVVNNTLAFGHKFLNPQFNAPSDEFVTEEEIMSLGYNVVFLGHDHVAYPMTKVGSTVVVRPGALSRGTKHGYNKVRDVFVAVMNDDPPELKFLKVPCAPAEDVFIKEDYTEMAIKEELTKFVDLVRSQMSRERGKNVFDIVRSMRLDADVKRLLMEYFVGRNIFKQGETNV